MGAPLFAPDLFSKPHPAFQSVSPDLLEELKDVLNQHYGLPPQKILSAEKLEGLEINSRNFRVITDSDIYALKCAGPQTKVAAMDVQLHISQELLKREVAIPHVFSTHTGLLYAADKHSKFWILSKFVEGTYFNGSSEHLLKTFQTIHDLQYALESLDDATMLPLSTAAHTWPETEKILQELFSRQTEWNDLFPASEHVALIRESDYLRQLFEKISIFEANSKKTIVPTHIDLHPHNILIDKQGNPVIVDIDSLQRADKTQSMAFAAFKLIRQHLVHDKPADITIPVRQFMDIMDIQNTAIETFGHSATTEVLRRIGIIANLNMHQANRQWNEVLHMQLAALHEIPHIFKIEG